MLFRVELIFFWGVQAQGSQPRYRGQGYLVPSSPPVAGGRAGIEVMKMEEVVLPLTSCTLEKVTPALHLGSTEELLLLGESGELPMAVRGMGRYLAILLTTCVGGGRAGLEVLRVEELFLPLTSYSTWERVLSTSPGPLGGEL